MIFHALVPRLPGTFDRRVPASRIQKAMHVDGVRCAREHRAIASDGVTAGANPQHIREERAGRSDLGETSAPQHESAPGHHRIGRQSILADDIAAVVDPGSNREVGAGISQLTSACRAEFAGSRAPNHPARCVYRPTISPEALISRATVAVECRKIDRGKARLQLRERPLRAPKQQHHPKRHELAQHALMSSVADVVSTRVDSALFTSFRR